MDEENNFLKEQEETVAAENPRTPVADFAFWLRDLGGCASFRGNFVSLDRAKADVIASDAGEAFQSKAKCRDAAKKRVDEAIHEAEQKTECRMSVSGSSSFYQEFRQRFDHRLDALREKLELLRTPENAAIINKIASHLIASEIHRISLQSIYSCQPAHITVKLAMMRGIPRTMRLGLQSSLPNVLCGMDLIAMR